MTRRQAFDTPAAGEARLHRSQGAYRIYQSHLSALVLALASSLALAGCTPREPAPPATAATWDWRAFPSEDRLLVAHQTAHAGPARSAAVRAPANGVLRLAAGLDPDQPLAEGAVWGRIELDDTEAEEDAVRRLEAEIERRRQRYIEIERPTLLAQLERELRAAEETAAAATFAEREPGLFAGDRPVLDPALRPGVSAGQATHAVNALRERRERIAAGDTALEPADLQALRSELERRLATRDFRARQLRLTAPLGGRLALADRRDGRGVAAGETIALIVDPTSLRISLQPMSPLLLAVPAETLEVEISIPAGGTVCARFTASGFDATGTPVLWFEAPVEPAAVNSLGAAGAELPARIFARLPASALIIPKLTVAGYDTSDRLAAGWRAAIPQLFPGARLVAEGRTAVAVQPPAR